MKKNIAFVYFDIGGVLMRWQGMMEAIAVKYGKEKTVIEEAYWKYDDLACRGQMTTQRAWELMCKDLDLQHAAALDFVSFCFETFSPIETMHVLARKAAKRYPIGLLTNIHPGAVDGFLRKKFIPDLPYTAIVESCDVGYVKPEREMYEIAREKAGVPHENIFFVDDFPQNVIGARSLGWHSVQFQTDTPEKSVKEIRKMLGLAN